jgi:hypothetical protein
VQIRTIDFEPWDQLIRAVGDSSQKMALAFFRFNAELDRLNYVEMTKAPHIVIHQNYDEAFALIGKAEELLAVTLRDTDNAIKARNQRIAQGEFGKFKSFRKKLDEQAADLYTFTGDFGEAFRNLFLAQRQVVLYLREHKGHVTVAKDSEMVVFEDDASTVTMNEIFDRLKSAGETLEAVTDSEISHENALISKINDVVKKAGK